MRPAGSRAYTTSVSGFDLGCPASPDSTGSPPSLGDAGFVLLASLTPVELSSRLNPRLRSEHLIGAEDPAGRRHRGASRIWFLVFFKQRSVVFQKQCRRWKCDCVGNVSMPGCLLFTGGRFCLRFCLHKLSLPCGAAPHIKQLSEYLNVLKVLSSEHTPPVFGTIRLQDRKMVPLTAHWMLPTESLLLRRVIFFFLSQVRHQGSEEQKKKNLQ